MINITGGSFLLGSSKLECGPANGAEIDRCDLNLQALDALVWIDQLTWVPQAAVSQLPDFQMDEHEVTVAQYQYCVELNACTPPGSEAIKGVSYYDDPRYADHPVVHVTRQQAREYCAFWGRALPTEAQWERAARLGPNNEVRTYPWAGGAPSTCDKGSKQYAVARGCSDLPPPVSYSDADRTYLGVRNMASNVSEWVLDDWHRYAFCAGRAGYNEACQRQGVACVQCKNDLQACARSCTQDNIAICKAGAYSIYTGNSTEGVARGGSYMQGPCWHRLFVRQKGTAAQADLGFRCSR